MPDMWRLIPPFMAAGHTYEEDRYTCQSCPDENMAFSGGQCACVSGYTLTGQTAIGPQMCIKTAQASTLKTGYPEVSHGAQTEDMCISGGRRGGAERT